MIFYIYLLLFPFFINAYELSVCTIFRNDAKYLPEWIEFHQNHGVEHFYLYNNDSGDHPEVILQPYIDSNLVTLIDWSGSHENQLQWNLIQVQAYMNCIDKIRNQDKWCAFLDTDEFLFSPNKKLLPEVLEDYISYPSIMAYWRCYGTSNVFQIPDNEKIINHLTYRAKDDHWMNGHMKQIVQPKYVKDCINPHIFVFDELPFDMNKSTDILRINHYWSRDIYFFQHEKIGRYLKWGRDVGFMINLQIEMNEIYDPILIN